MLRSASTIHSPIEMLEGRRLLSGVISIGAVADTAYRQTGEDGILVITRRGDLSSDLTVPLLVSGSATNGVGYGRIGSEVVIPAGTQSVALKVRTPYSGQSSRSEYVSVAIGEVAGYRTGRTLASVNIVDNTASLPPVRGDGVAITSLRTTNDIRRGIAGRFVLVRSGDVSGSATIPIQVGGTAVNGSDFGFIGDSVTFLPGQDQMVISVRSGNAVFSGNRTVTLMTGELPGAVPNPSSLMISGVTTNAGRAGTLPGGAVGPGTRLSGTPIGVSTEVGGRVSTTPTSSAAEGTPTTGGSAAGMPGALPPTSSRFSELPGAVVTGSTNGQTQFGTTGIGTSLGVGTTSSIRAS